MRQRKTSAEHTRLIAVVTNWSILQHGSKASRYKLYHTTEGG